MYHLIFLSHMSRNIIESSRTELEWMSETLTRPFYNNQHNPFHLPFLKVLHDARSMEKKFPGPKLVLCSDVSLNYGLSKELLLKYGGDPRCRIIFMDHLGLQLSTPTTTTTALTLAQELKMKSQAGPVLATINIPTRIELTGKELTEYRRKQEKRRLELEEENQRKKRQQELSQFATDVQDDNLGEDDDEETSGSKPASKVTTRTNNTILAKLLANKFTQFSNTDPILYLDEFGASVDDLEFKDIQPAEAR